jgi:hypothetical protein
MKEIRVVDVETEKRHVNEYHRLFMSKQITFPVIKMAFGWTSHCKHMETKTRDSCFITVSLEWTGSNALRVKRAPTDRMGGLNVQIRFAVTAAIQQNYHIGSLQYPKIHENSYKNSVISILNCQNVLCSNVERFCFYIMNLCFFSIQGHWHRTQHMAHIVETRGGNEWANNYCDIKFQ